MTARPVGRGRHESGGTHGGATGDWQDLYLAVNGLPGRFGAAGVRDPDYPCELFDGKTYDGRDDCNSDGHYMCDECSHLSPEAPRFTEPKSRHGNPSGDRLRLYWHRKGGPIKKMGLRSGS